MSQSMSGKVALITGSAGGIGLAIAQRFAVAGSKIVLTSRDAVRGRAAETALRESGADVCFLQADISNEDEVRKLVAAALEAFGCIDALVNNAGPSGEAFGLSSIHELPTHIFEQTMRVGVYGPLWCCKYALPHMVARRSGVVINISAIAGARAIPLMGAYAIAKAALDALSRQVASDYAADGVRCNTLLVGTVRPKAHDVSTLPADFDHTALDGAIGKTTMLGHVGDYADVAEAALFLASESSKYITGAAIPVEGGALAKLQYPDYSSELN